MSRQSSLAAERLRTRKLKKDLEPLEAIVNQIQSGTDLSKVNIAGLGALRMQDAASSKKRAPTQQSESLVSRKALKSSGVVKQMRAEFRPVINKSLISPQTPPLSDCNRGPLSPLPPISCDATAQNDVALVGPPAADDFTRDIFADDVSPNDSANNAPAAPSKPPTRMYTVTYDSSGECNVGTSLHGTQSASPANEADVCTNGFAGIAQHAQLDIQVAPGPGLIAMPGGSTTAQTGVEPEGAASYFEQIQKNLMVRTLVSTMESSQRCETAHDRERRLLKQVLSEEPALPVAPDASRDADHAVDNIQVTEQDILNELAALKTARTRTSPGIGDPHA